MLISTSSAASIEETIHFDELPNDTVTIRATMDVSVSTSSVTGFSLAFATMNLGGCSVSTSSNNGGKASSQGSCDAIGAAAGCCTVTLVLSRDQLLAQNLQVDIIANVGASLESQGGINGQALASGGFSLSRGGEPEPGTIHIDIDPPLAHHYTGSMTAFPVPEPGVPLLAAVGATTIFAARRRAWRDG